MKSETRNRLLAVGALLVAGGALAYLSADKIGDNLVYYWTPSELVSQGQKAYGPTIRLGGLVAPGSIKWNEAHTGLTFQVADGEKAGAVKVPVQCDQVPPQMFREKIGVVVEGTYDSSGTFKSNRLMVNHSNEYKPPKEGQDTKEFGAKTMEPQAAR